MRIGNLASIDLERHIKSISFKREKWTQVHIPGEEVKNNRALNYELGAETTKLLDLYLTVARPVLVQAPSDYLFPARNGGPKRPSGLSAMVKKTIREETGLDINAHLFRSIAGKLHSLAAPGDVVTLSHVLHNSLTTTLKSYSQFEQKSAIKHYQRTVDGARKNSRGRK